MESVMYFAIPLNTGRFHFSEVHNPIEVCEMDDFNYLIKDEDGDEYISSNKWSFNYSVYDDDVEIDFDGVDISNESSREYVFKSGVLTVRNPKKILIDSNKNMHFILTYDNRIYRIRNCYQKILRYLK